MLVSHGVQLRGSQLTNRLSQLKTVLSVLPKMDTREGVEGKGRGRMCSHRIAMQNANNSPMCLYEFIIIIIAPTPTER